MFQSIGNSLADKQRTIEQSIDREQKIKLSVKRFLKETYPIIAHTATVIYQSDARMVRIIASKKSDADTLLLHTKDIRAHLKAEHITIGKIAVLPSPNS